jgi:hypothetical protein
MKLFHFLLPLIEEQKRVLVEVVSGDGKLARIRWNGIQMWIQNGFEILTFRCLVLPLSFFPCRLPLSLRKEASCASRRS